MKNRIAAQLVTLGLLTAEEVALIKQHSKSTGLRFAEAAINLGFFRDSAMLSSPESTSRINVFHLNPDFYPEETKHLLSIDDILRFGVLPLGFKTSSGLFRKRRDLNLGILDPTQKHVPMEIEKKVREKFPDLTGVRCYLVLVEQFLSVLHSVYKQDLALPNHRDIEKTLLTFLNNSTRERKPLPGELT